MDDKTFIAVLLGVMAIAAHLQAAKIDRLQRALRKAKANV